MTTNEPSSASRRREVAPSGGQATLGLLFQFVLQRARGSLSLSLSTSDSAATGRAFFATRRLEIEQLSLVATLLATHCFWPPANKSASTPADNEKNSLHSTCVMRALAVLLGRSRATFAAALEADGAAAAAAR